VSVNTVYVINIIVVFAVNFWRHKPRPDAMRVRSTPRPGTTRKAMLTQSGTRNSCASSYASDPYALSVDLIRTAFGYNFTEGPVKQNQSPDDARRPTAKCV